MPISGEQPNTRDDFKINVLQYILIFAISSLVLIGGTANYYISAQSPIGETAQDSNYAEDDYGGGQDGFLKGELTVFDDDYVVELFVSGLHFPTAIDFVGNDLLVLEKNTGKVIRINENGEIDKEPVLVVPVYNYEESGLLGIATTPNHVFLYFTESFEANDPQKPNKNTVYQYDWDGNNLTNPILIKELSADSWSHNGGVFAKGQNGEIYFVTGDDGKVTIFQNHPSYPSSNETGSIFKIYTDDDNRVELFAVGIRNSFGLAVDPVTGYLWQTENGPREYDEINLVKNKFNSGWMTIMGPSNRSDAIIDQSLYEKGIQSLEGFAYSDPEFSWHTPVGVTAIAFPDMTNFGKYQDWLFVGDFNNGRIYKFQLNSDRTEFIFSAPNLKDLVYDSDDKLNEIVFAETFPGGVTDIKFGHDAMYVVSPFNHGSIYKIYPKQPIVHPSQTSLPDTPILEIEETSEELPLAGIILTIIGAVIIGIIVSVRKKRKAKLSNN